MPGGLARLGQALGDQRVNIEAAQGAIWAGEGLVGLVSDGGARARRALDAAGFRTRA